RTRPRPARASGGASARHGRATAAAPRPRRPRAPGRTCTRAALGGPRRPGATRAGSPPRRRHGSGRCPAAARPGSGSASRPWADHVIYARRVTPLERAPAALAAFAGRDGLWLKREDLHELGMFKWRSTLPVVRLLAGDAVVTSSTGNHGAAVAWACKEVGV